MLPHPFFSFSGKKYSFFQSRVASLHTNLFSDRNHQETKKPGNGLLSANHYVAPCRHISGRAAIKNFFKLQKVPKRNCFHPGVSGLNREQIPLEGEKVSSMQMLEAMTSYIWPQVSILPKLFLPEIIEYCLLITNQVSSSIQCSPKILHSSVNFFANESNEPEP